MKYKQRIVIAVVLTALSLSSLLIYNNKSDPSRSLTFSFNAGESTCPVFNPSITAEWTVDSIYDNLNFTRNSKDGLYTVNEKLNFHKSEKEKYFEPLEIIVVPHSHNDPGWLWTFEDYYTIRTRQILTNTVRSLQRFPDFRMIWTETVFLERWWNESPEGLRNEFKKLVLDGKIEILSGGWVSVDEATTHYGAVLDQLIEGHLWVKEHFGVFPNISWSIDPFGYSKTLPYLWKKSGMNDMAILRIHGAVKGYMANRRMLTYNWRQPWDDKGKHDITCHVEPFTLYNIECSCGPDTEVCRVLDFSSVGSFPESDSEEIHFGKGRTAENFHAYVKLVVEQYKKKAEQYNHNVILMPHGDDFRYIEEYDFELNYKNMKRLMDYVNSKKEFHVKMRFGTVRDYFEVLHAEINSAKSQETSLIGDFFTYTDKDDEYWSGYFTTRPFDKRMIRDLFNLLRTTETMTSLIYVYLLQTTHINAEDWEADWKVIQAARRTHGLLQHHDAITGTSTAGTVVDFEMRMFKAITELTEVLQKRFTSMVTPGTKTNIPDFQMTMELISPLKPIVMKTVQMTSDTISLLFVNSYTRSRKEVVSFHVNTFAIVVYDSNNRKVNFQISPIWSTYNTISNKGFEINFEIKIPAVGFSVYKIKKKQWEVKSKETQSLAISKLISHTGKISLNEIFKPEFKTVHQTRIFHIENNYLKISFLNVNGALEFICFKNEPEYCIKTKMNIFRYKGSNSNAYCFNVTGKEEDLFSHVKSVIITRGPVMSQVKIHHRLFTQTVTLYHSDSIQGQGIHIENNATLLSPDDRDTELMMRLSTNIKNEGMRYHTDSNGFQMVQRRLRRNLPVGANFYPFTTMALIEDQETRLTLHTGQPLGIGSFSVGSLEVILDRVPMSFGKGLDESVTDNKPAISKFILQAERLQLKSYVKTNQMHPSATSHMVNDLLQNPVVSLYTMTSTKINMKEFSFLETGSLPCNVVFANFRSLLTEQARFLGTGLTLHKRAQTCGVHESENICPQSNNLNLDSLFQHLELNTVKHMSLSHLFEKSSEGLNKIDTMELESFQFNWKS